MIRQTIPVPQEILQQVEDTFTILKFREFLLEQPLDVSQYDQHVTDRCALSAFSRVADFSYPTLHIDSGNGTSWIRIGSSRERLNIQLPTWTYDFQHKAYYTDHYGDWTPRELLGVLESIEILP